MVNSRSIPAPASRVRRLRSRVTAAAASARSRYPTEGGDVLGVQWADDDDGGFVADRVGDEFITTEPSRDDIA